MRVVSGSIIVLTVGVVFIGCGGSDSGSGAGGSPSVGGGRAVGGTSNSSTTSTSGGAHPVGHPSTGGMATGGNPNLGGSTNTPLATGGSPASGSSATSVSLTGGSKATGGTSPTGGANATGGTSPTGGANATGGTPATGGSVNVSAAGGTSSAGGKSATGGASTPGGSSAKGGTSSTGGTSAGGSGSNAKPSTGCGKTPTLKNSPSAATQNTLTVSGTSRQFVMRWPTNYDNTHPYRLILDFHGAGGKDTDLAPSYFGLFDLSNNTTIFIAPSANGGYWDATADLTFVDQILTTVEADLCIDTSRVELEGFSQGGAMIAALACQRPGVFRAAVGHSRGGLTAPTTCQPIPYLGSLGLSDISGNSQATQTDPFAQWNGCTVTTMPLAPTGSHVCTNYTGCPAADPVIFCSFDGPHTASPTDSGKSTSWMPQEVWPFLSQF